MTARGVPPFLSIACASHTVNGMTGSLCITALALYLSYQSARTSSAASSFARRRALRDSSARSIPSMRLSFGDLADAGSFVVAPFRRASRVSDRAPARFRLTKWLP